MLFKLKIKGFCCGSVMITKKVIQHTFYIQYNNARGTAFAIGREGKQYLVTAHHVVEDIVTGNCIQIYHKKRWKKTAVEVVGTGNDNVDVAVLALPGQVAPQPPLEASIEGVTYSQPVYFLGFPLGLSSGMENLNRGFSVPFVKAGVVSAIADATSQIYIDAHGNKGFSGGPLVFAPKDKPANEFRVAGVISSAPRPLRHPVVDKSGMPLVGDDGEPIAYFRENQGLVVAIDISHVIDLIDANPIGFVLPTEMGNQ